MLAQVNKQHMNLVVIGKSRILIALVSLSVSKASIPPTIHFLGVASLF